MDEIMVTRGHGYLEFFLSKQRAKRANHLIPQNLRTGAICDIGCGSYPYFLTTTEFRNKYAIDQVQSSWKHDDIKFFPLDINVDGKMPFDNCQLDVITMLAVFEHLEPERLPSIFLEIYRILKPGGKFIMTTPTKWAEPVLNIMARLKLVSSVELDEHKDAYSINKILPFFENAGFAPEKTTYGYFEFFMNLWVSSEKENHEARNS